MVARETLLETLGWLRDDPDLSFGFLSSLTATDWPGKDPRFWVAYELRSMEHRHRLRVKVGLTEADATMPDGHADVPHGELARARGRTTSSASSSTAIPDLTRILLPDEWEGHPLRKTEELGGVNTRYHGAFIPPVDTADHDVTHMRTRRRTPRS